jgi:hypothetical protein
MLLYMAHLVGHFSERLAVVLARQAQWVTLVMVASTAKKVPAVLQVLKAIREVGATRASQARLV